MKCPKCGSLIYQNTNFCSNCGYRIEHSDETKNETLNEQNHKKKKINPYFMWLMISFIIGCFAMCVNTTNGAILFISILIISETLLFIWNKIIKAPTEKNIKSDIRQTIKEEQRKQEFVQNKEIYGLINENEPVGIKKYVKYTAENLVELTGCPRHLLLNEYTSVKNEHSKFSDPNFFNKYWIIKAGYKYTNVNRTRDLRYNYNPYLPEHYCINIKLEDQIFYIMTYDKNVFKELIKYFRKYGIWLRKYDANFGSKFLVILIISMPILFIIWCCF